MASKDSAVPLSGTNALQESVEPEREEENSFKYAALSGAFSPYLGYSHSLPLFSTLAYIMRIPSILKLGRARGNVL